MALQKISRQIVVAAIIAVLPTSTTFAYDAFSHRQIIVDAFAYIVAKADDGTQYADGTFAKDDFALLRSVLASSQKDISAAKQRLRQTAASLGDHAVETDQQPDVVLDLPALGNQPSATSPLGTRYFFTLFSHFINVHRPGSLWPVAGYHYLWVETNQRCTNPTNEDLFGNLFTRYGRAKVSPSASVATINFRGNLRSNVMPNAYDQNFTNEIRFVEFWPLTNVAEFWYDAFLQSPPDADRLPYKLQYLSHVLHAIADATVPYHATGISGCGHRAYERTVDILYKSRKLLDYNLVQKYLMTESYLTTNMTVEKVIGEIARTASDHTICTCGGVTCDCPVALKNPERVGKKLVNLAVAATVVTIRKALLQWRNNQSKETPVSTPSDFGKTKKQAVRIMYSDFPVLSRQDWLGVTGVPGTTSIDPEVIESLTTMNGFVAEYKKQRLTPEQFRNTYSVAVDNWASIAAKYPVMVQYRANLSEKPLEFRDPMLVEIQDEIKWEQYLGERRRFYAAANLLTAGIESGLLKSRVARAFSTGEKESLETSLRVVAQVQDVAIRELAASK